MSLDKAGFKEWINVKFFAGKNPDGTARTREGYKNAVTDQEFIPEGGWNTDPPHPTGDLSNCRHVSPKYRQNFDFINWGKNL